MGISSRIAIISVTPLFFLSSIVFLIVPFVIKSPRYFCGAEQHQHVALCVRYVTLRLLRLLRLLRQKKFLV